MYYFGRIIGAFFNQLFRFLFWNKFGQKILIAIIILLIAFWCVGMTEVHAVEEVRDINYEAFANYDSIINDAILRLGNVPRGEYQALFNRIKDGGYDFYFYYGQNDGSSYNNAFPTNKYVLHIMFFSKGSNVIKTISNYDYRGLTSIHQYTFDLSNASNFGRFDINGNNVFPLSQSVTSYYQPIEFYGYYNQNWIDFVDNLVNNKDAEMVQLLEDIKAEQQATNDFLTEENDDTLMNIDTPTYTDSASDNMSSNLHDSINSLTTQMQTTVSNYYEGWDAYSWVIPLPSYIGGNITFDSGVTRKIIGTSGVLYNLIQAVWVILFGGYIIGFIKRMLDWVQTGKIFDEGGLSDFIWWMDTNNEIIKASMM